MKTFLFFTVALFGIALASSQTSYPESGSTAASTTASQTTTLAPSNSTDRALKRFVYKKSDNDTCLIVTLEAYFNKSGSIVNVTSDAVVKQTESSCGKLVVSFGKNSNFTLTFQNDSKMYWLHQVDVFLGSLNASGSGSNMSIGKSTLKASYKCDAGFTARLYNDITMEAKKVQFQAFQVKENEYGTAQICTADIGNNILIPIVVGSALVGLIAIVLVAYLIGRKRVKHRYEAM